MKIYHEFSITKGMQFEKKATHSHTPPHFPDPSPCGITFNSSVFSPKKHISILLNNTYDGDLNLGPSILKQRKRCSIYNIREVNTQEPKDFRSIVQVIYL